MVERRTETPATQLPSMTEGLLRNWPESDITVSTFCLTSFANLMLSNRSASLYHMQHFEPLFFDDRISQGLAQATYFLPLSLVANSRWLQKQIKSRVGRQSSLLNPGIDTDVFHPRRDAEQKYYGPTRLTILSYCSATPFKAWGDAVEAMRLLARTVDASKYEWVVYGSAPPATDVAHRYVGRVFGAELAELYSQAHVVFMNSWYESFPLPPLEAMACGTAAITTPLGTEDYAKHEKNSLIVPPRRPDLLAQAIIRLLEDRLLAARLAAQGVEDAGRFSWVTAADRLEQILGNVASSYQPGRFADVPRLALGQL